MKLNVFDALTQLLDVMWRRRYLLAVPLVIMVPLSIFGSRFLPQTYVSKALLAMQETGSDNPLIKPPGTTERIRERAPGLQALLKSDRVLVNALRDILGPAMPADPHGVAMAVRDLDSQLSFEMIGTDFLELQLKGGTPRGLGRKLDAVTSRFLESLVSPEQNALSATQVLLEKRRDDVATAEKAVTTFRQQLGDRALAAIAASEARRGELQAALQTRTAEARTIDAQIAALRTSLGVFAAPENSGRRDAEISLAAAQAEAAEKRGTSAQALADAHLARSRAAQLEQLQATEIRAVTAQREITEVTATLADMASVGADVRSPEGQLRRLEREAADAREIYENYRKRYPSANGTSSLKVLNAPERIRVIDAPHDPEFPATSRLKFIVAGILAGVLMSLGLAGCAELFDQTLRRPTDFEDAAGVPVIGRLPPEVRDPHPDDSHTAPPSDPPTEDGPRPRPDLRASVIQGGKSAA